MNFRNLKLIFALLLFNSSACLAQQNIELIYAPDPMLHNGRIYNYGKSVNLDGHQYLKSEQFLEGAVTINDTTYSRVNLNYDIYNQEILYKYNYEHQTKVISLATEIIDEFSIQNSSFIILNQSTQPVIYKRIGDKQLKILIYYEKELKLYSSASGSYYKFSKPNKSFYTYDKSTLKGFKSRRSFLKLFPENNRPAIKKYMKQNKIRIKRASDQKLKDLINFCNTI